MLLHVSGALWTTSVLYPFYGEARRSRYVQKWSKKLLDICGVKVRVHHPERLSSKALIVSNHVSWLDIFLIHSVTPCHFIAKAEMADWPIIGSLAKSTGTLFLERSRTRHLKSTLETLVKYLKARERCIFFPEGTTAKQGELLPFHPNLFEGAIHAELPIQPFAVKYVNHMGEFEDAVDFSGDIGMNENVNSILGKDRIFAERRFCLSLTAMGKAAKIYPSMPARRLCPFCPKRFKKVGTSHLKHRPIIKADSGKLPSPYTASIQRNQIVT